jgi:hypothetical protein
MNAGFEGISHFLNDCCFNMNEEDYEILDSRLVEEPRIRRRSLLPLWIKVFIWIFMIFGAIAPLAFVRGLFGPNLELSLYGIEAYRSLTLIGLVLFLLFVLKGIAAFGLWTEKEWAIKVAMVDAYLGIAICVFMTLVYPFINGMEGFRFNLRLELVALIPYAIKLDKIKEQWAIATDGNNL